MSEFISYSVANDQAFKNALTRAAGAVSDLRIPLTLISKDFYKSQVAIWALKSPGQYPDLAPSTKRDRERRAQPYYPILRRTGRLEKSLTSAKHSDSINQIINRDTLIIGTEVPYAVFHQEGAPGNNLPMRKVLFIGPEAPRFATSEQMGRLERWTNILNAYVMGAARQELNEFVLKDGV